MARTWRLCREQTRACTATSRLCRGQARASTATSRLFREQTELGRRPPVPAPGTAVTTEDIGEEIVVGAR